VVPIDRRRLSIWRVLLVAILALYHGDLLPAATGIDPVITRQIGSAILIPAGAISFGVILARGDVAHFPFLLWPLVLVGLFIITSLFSNSLFFPKPMEDWLYAHYMYLPLTLVYVLMALRFTDKEVYWGLVGVGLVAIGLMALYYFDLAPFLSYYARRSIFGVQVERVVVLKYEVLLAVLALFTSLLNPHITTKLKPICLIILIAALLLLVELVQSRLVLLGTGLGFALLLICDPRTYQHRSFIVRGTFAVIGLMLMPLLIGDYLSLLGRSDLLESQEMAVYVRIHTFDHYRSLFESTYGVGFGMSSATGLVNNVISESMAELANFNDLGLYGALFQFGVLGGLAAAYLSLTAVVVSYRAMRVVPDADRWRPAVLCAFFTGGLCSPLPVNVFTLEWSMYFAGFMLYLIWYYRAANHYYRHPVRTSGAFDS
jgi:hypothetical protein